MMKAVLLVNLGGPHSLDDVRPYLFRIFKDPEIFPLPQLFQKILAQVVVKWRLKTSKSYYQKIGGKSPLLEQTEAQAQALGQWLSSEGIQKVFIGMQHNTPFIPDVLEKLRHDGFRELAILPLYPQFSWATTRTALRTCFSAVKNKSLPLRLHVIQDFHDHPLYIEALVQTIKGTFDLIPADQRFKAKMIFSAHSLPYKLIQQGDPYLAQTKKTVELVLKKLPFHVPSTLSFQSRTGPIRWMGPRTDVTLKSILRVEKEASLLMVPISFVSEHVETLYELDILYKEMAQKLGCAHFYRVPTLQTHPLFIQLLKELTLSALARPAWSERQIL